jgi:hypothetical protein
MWVGYFERRFNYRRHSIRDSDSWLFACRLLVLRINRDEIIPLSYLVTLI